MKDQTDRMEKNESTHINEPPHIYSALTIADWIINKHLEKDRYPVDALRLQKLVYLSFGWFWAVYKKDLFEDEIQAWKYGPVIPLVYYAYRHKGDNISHIIGCNESEKLTRRWGCSAAVGWS